MKNLITNAALVLMFVTTLATTAMAAEEIVIQDSSGVARSTSQVDGLGRVDFSVVDAAGNPAENAAVTLTNAATGETITATSTAGGVTFDSVAAGTWTVTSATPGLTFTNVTILAVATSTVAGAGIATGTALGVLGGAGAATAAGVGIHNATSGDSDNSVLSPFS